MKPIINIRYGNLIDPFFKDSVIAKYPDYDFPSEEKVLEKVELFKKAWEEQGNDIIDFLYKETGLEFKRNIIDCFIVSATPRDMSAPLIIRSRYNEKEFISVMMHELIHKLFSDNKIKKEGYENESKTTRNHIKIFNLMKKYYLEVLKDKDYLNEIMERSNTESNKDYRRAWEIVNSIE